MCDAFYIIMHVATRPRPGHACMQHARVSILETVVIVSVGGITHDGQVQVEGNTISSAGTLERQRESRTMPTDGESCVTR